ncbi:MAG: transposase, partial [Gammaproteobacteria bacterium]|nr:transposase [Gammaproteobacteria bacterium]
MARYNAVEKDLQRESNRLEKAEFNMASSEVIESIHIVMKELKKELKRLKDMIDQHIDQSPSLKKDRKFLESIPGVGPVVSQYMIAMIRSRDFKAATQCSAYVGLNPVHYESGSSVRG